MPRDEKTNYDNQQILELCGFDRRYRNHGDSWPCSNAGRFDLAVDNPVQDDDSDPAERSGATLHLTDGFPDKESPKRDSASICTKIYGSGFHAM
jgi:hypothetical protein